MEPVDPIAACCSQNCSFSGASKTPKTPQFATGALVRPGPDIANESTCFQLVGGGAISTPDPQRPRQVRYQAALRPDM